MKIENTGSCEIFKLLLHIQLKKMHKLCVNLISCRKSCQNTTKIKKYKLIGIEIYILQPLNHSSKI